jgi:hypothetical protein
MTIPTPMPPTSSWPRDAACNSRRSIMISVLRRRPSASNCLAQLEKHEHYDQQPCAGPRELSDLAGSNPPTEVAELLAIRHAKRSHGGHKRKQKPESLPRWFRFPGITGHRQLICYWLREPPSRPSDSSATSTSMLCAVTICGREPPSMLASATSRALSRGDRLVDLSLATGRPRY